MSAEVERHRLDVRARLVVHLAAERVALDRGAVADTRLVVERLHAAAVGVPLVPQLGEECLGELAVHDAGLAQPELGRVLGRQRLDVEEAVGATERELVVAAIDVVLLRVGANLLTHANLQLSERARGYNQKLAKLSIVGYHACVIFYGNSSF